MKKLTIISIIFLGIASESFAQTIPIRDRFFLGWEVTFPSNDFISKTGFYNIHFSYNRMIKPNLSVGIATSWNSFEQYVPRTTYQKPEGNGAITTDIVKQLYSVPITANFKYYLKGGNKILPYAGLGIGTQYSQQTIYFNVYDLEDDTWGFALRPEIGVIYPFTKSSAIYVNGAFNYASNNSDIFGNDNLNHWVLSVGFAFSK